MNNSQRLRNIINSQETAWAAGAYDALSAKLIEGAGFPVIMSSGFGIAASHLGQPDAELYTMSENLAVVRNIVGATSIPVVADIDTGYGNALNVMRSVREFEKAGVAGVILEDQESPKRCPCMTGSISLVPKEEAASKIRAAVDARQNPNLVIIARTDAANEEEAIDRAQAYVEAGADLIQPISKCFHDFSGLKRLREAVGVPLSLQILGWLEQDLSAQEIEEVAGMATYALVPLMTATVTVGANLRQLFLDKSTKELPHPVKPMSDFNSFIGFDDIMTLQKKYLLSEDQVKSITSN